MSFLHQKQNWGGYHPVRTMYIEPLLPEKNWDAPHRSPRKTTSQPQCHMFWLLRCHAGALQLYIWSIKPRLNSTLAGQAVHQEFQIINHWFGGFQLGKLWKNGLSSPSLSSLLTPAKKWSLRQIDGKTHPASLGFLSVRVLKQPHVLKKHWQHAPETSTIRPRLNPGNEDLDQHAEMKQPRCLKMVSLWDQWSGYVRLETTRSVGILPITLQRCLLTEEPTPVKVSVPWVANCMKHKWRNWFITQEAK